MGLISTANNYNLYAQEAILMLIGRLTHLIQPHLLTASYNSSDEQELNQKYSLQSLSYR